MSILDPHYGWHQGSYTPTQAEIRQQCWEIQAGWTPAERRRRAPHYAAAQRVEFPHYIGDYDALAFYGVE
jgi:hypothetical protein